MKLEEANKLLDIALEKKRQEKQAMEDERTLVMADVATTIISGLKPELKELIITQIASTEEIVKVLESLKNHEIEIEV